MNPIVDVYSGVFFCVGRNEAKTEVFNKSKKASVFKRVLTLSLKGISSWIYYFMEGHFLGNLFCFVLGILFVFVWERVFFLIFSCFCLASIGFLAFGFCWLLASVGLWLAVPFLFKSQSCQKKTVEELDEHVEELDEHELHHKPKLAIGVSIHSLRRPGISIDGRDDHPFHRWDVVGRKFSTRWVTIVINGVRGPINGA